MRFFPKEYPKITMKKGSDGSHLVRAFSHWGLPVTKPLLIDIGLTTIYYKIITFVLRFRQIIANYSSDM